MGTKSYDSSLFETANKSDLSKFSKLSLISRIFKISTKKNIYIYI